MALAPDKPPFMFLKLDIKDGFLRMSVPKQIKYNFAYVLPESVKLSLDMAQLVILLLLQMMWANSPLSFEQQQKGLQYCKIPTPSNH